MKVAVTGQVLRERIEAGESFAEIGRALNLAPTTVRRHCRAHGIAVPARRSGPARKLPAIEELLTRLQAGEGPTGIARSVGVTRAAVIRALDRAGWRYVGAQLNTSGKD